ncbi:adhesion G-protein coupled receptor G4 [Lates japonicus]|uniref:Adhesion G-protein coupled receptor G4 n=1 Tax=Lates japonicus TaxID=270547 RepID=A0AAD3RJU8_LATJO|nr:adhesion G-protein coupled receptor G4 [Lates japonicus]
MERGSIFKLKDKLDSGDILLGDEDEDSDDEPAVLSLPGMSPAESILDEELLLDQTKDTSTKTEVWRTEWHKNHMAAISSVKFDSLLKMSPDFQGCKSHLAAFVLIREVLDTAGCPREHYTVVALGAGRSSCSKWLCYNGTMVHDCHAIVIARRALLRFLYKQLLLFFDADPNARENCIFKSSADSHQLQLKPKISLHLYTNQCPEGAAKNFYFKYIKLYFEVKMNVSITGDCEPEEILSTWLNSSLPDDTMMVLDLQLLPKTQRCLCADFQVILECNAETHQTMKGLFEWPATSGGKNATQPCPKNPHRHATRHCKLCLSTHWMAPDQEDCPPVVETIPDLDHVEVTADNALDVVEMIEGLLRNHSTLNYQELVTVLNKLEDIVNLSVVTPNLGQALINIISDILESDSDLLPFTNIIVNLTEAVGDRMVGYEGSSTLVAPAIAISVVDVVPGQFNSLTFGVLSDRTGTKPEIFINKYPFNSTVAFISLPSALQHSFPENNLNQSPPRVQFQFYGIPLLFKSSQQGQTLNTFVVSASVTNASAPIKDLDEDIKVTLHHLIPNTLSKDVQCVYWNFNKNNGQGGWDDYGCRKYNSSFDYTTCLCDHLTHFGVLLDVSRTQVDPANEQILTIITYVGCGVSSLFLGVTVLTYTVFEKLRRDYPSQILINLSLALLGLNLVFLVNSWLSSWGLYALCVAAASTLHYFLLATFTWMGLEAVNMYFALVKVFNVYVPSYILKFCALGWGLPLMICILVLIVNREAYGSHLYTDASLESLDNSDNL